MRVAYTNTKMVFARLLGGSRAAGPLRWEEISVGGILQAGVLQVQDDDLLKGTSTIDLGFLYTDHHELRKKQCLWLPSS